MTFRVIIQTAYKSCFALPAVRYFMEHTYDYTVTLFSPSANSIYSVRLLWLLLTSHSSLLLRLMRLSVRLHGISLCSFLVYTHDLYIWVTATFWASLPSVNLPAIYTLLSVFCPWGYDFALPSSRLHLTM